VIQMLDVFLAEDNSGDVHLVREALTQAGLRYQLHLATDGEAGLVMVGQFGLELPCPHVALLDLNMPRQDGSELLKRLREHPRCAHMPIVILTSSDVFANRRLAADYDAVFFRKPLDLGEFFEIGNTVKDLCRQPEAN